MVKAKKDFNSIRRIHCKFVTIDHLNALYPNDTKSDPVKVLTANVRPS